MAVTLNASTSSGFVQTADTSGEIVLQNNGTTRLSVLSTGVSGTLVQGTAVASTSGTSIDFTGIPSWVKRITVMFSGFSTSGTSVPLIQLGDSGGVENTGYASGGSVISASAVSSAVYTTGFGLATGLQVAAGTYQALAVIANVSGNTWNFSGSMNRTDTGAGGIGNGTKTLSDVLTQVRITTVNGTDAFDAGTINIQYEG
jgi:hypothetical protein